MTVKKKAEELIENFTERGFPTMDGIDSRKRYKQAIQHSIICVDEILKLPSLQEGRMCTVIQEDYDFWKQVKQEILSRQ